ncbi:MAG: hypothetical protein JOY54_14765 [Acidobacteriaceae bacterium]|nr:hypothetical protein [Acidobacteriaceae bacterium]
MSLKVKDQLQKRVLPSSLPALILSAACLLPYLSKPFTIDDPLFLQEAQHIRVSPLHPMLTQICWNIDNSCGPLAGTAPNNLLMSYLLVPVVASGAHEWLAHLMQILILGAGIIATVSLAFRFGFNTFGACAAGLILAASPPVLAMASTAMPDVLAMSLGVIGVERLIAWRQQGKSIDGVFCALALGLAGFARLHMVLLWACCVVLLRDNGRILNVKGWLALKTRWWPLAGSALICGIALVLTREPGSTAGPSQHWVSASFVRLNIWSYFFYWTLAMPLGLAWLVLRNRRMNLLALVPFCGFAIWKILTHPFPNVWKTLCFALGALVLVDIFLWAFQTLEQRRLFCALWLLIPLAALEYVHLPVKYLVPCAPAVALLVVDVLQTARWRNATLGVIVAAEVIWGSMVLQADAKFAEMGRDAAARLIKPHVAAGERVWFASQWGFQWYALKAGARPLWTNQMPARGDYLARGEIEGYTETLKRLPPATLVETYTVAGPGGRTMSRKDNAGLYSNASGQLMWAWGTDTWNRYELWRFH